MPELPEVKTPEFFDFSFMNTEINLKDIGNIEGDDVKGINFSRRYLTD